LINKCKQSADTESQHLKIPPSSQVEELQPILNRNKKLYVILSTSAPRRKRIKFEEKATSGNAKMYRKEMYPSNKMTFEDLRPEDSYFAGAVKGAMARKHQQRVEFRKRRRATQPPRSNEVASVVSTQEKYKVVADAPFQDDKLSNKMSTKQLEIESLIKSLLHVPHPTRSETTAEQATMYSGSKASISRELDDEEMWEEMGSGLLKEDQLSREELR
jgi:hypothetical protein